MPAPIRTAIPVVKPRIEPDVREVLQPLKEIVETITGRRPNVIIPDELGPSATLSDVINFCNQLRALLLTT